MPIGSSDGARACVIARSGRHGCGGCARALGSTRATTARCCRVTHTLRGRPLFASASRLHLRLLDLLETAAEAGGDLEEALSYLEQGIESDPYDDARYVRRAARILIEQGRLAHAGHFINRAERAADELGVGFSRTSAATRLPQALICLKDRSRVLEPAPVL